MSCKGCFGASFNDCKLCGERNNRMDARFIDIKYVKDGMEKIKQIEEVDHLSDTDRGGFGTTGEK